MPVASVGDDSFSVLFYALQPGRLSALTTTSTDRSGQMYTPDTTTVSYAKSRGASYRCDVTSLGFPMVWVCCYARMCRSSLVGRVVKDVLLSLSEISGRCSTALLVVTPQRFCSNLK